MNGAKTDCSFSPISLFFAAAHHTLLSGIYSSHANDQKYFLHFSFLFSYKISAPNVFLKCDNAQSCPISSKLATAFLTMCNLYPRLYASTAV